MGHSLEMYLLYQFPKTRNLLCNFLGHEYVLKYLGDPNASTQFLNYWGPIWIVTGIELLTEHMGHAIMIEKTKILHELYTYIYGCDPLQWEESIKEEYIERRFEIINSNSGLMTRMVDNAHLGSLYNTVITQIVEFLKELKGK
jgi:hypothetical protein